MKMMRKLIIGFCALVLVLGMATAVNAADATISITNAAEGQIYDAYRVFNYTPPDNEGGKGYYTLSVKFSGLPSYTYGYNENSVAMSSFFTVGDNDVLDTSGITKDNVDTFGKAVVAYARENGISNDGSTLAAEDGVATIPVSEYGYYAVSSSLGSKVSLVDVKSDSVSILEGNNIPTIDMKVTDATNSSGVYRDQTGNDAQIGDIVEFEITADLKKGGRDYAIVDILTPGLTLKDIQDSNVSFSNVTIGYSIDNRYDDENWNKGFKITFEREPAADTTVTVRFTAVVNKDAVIAADENTNEAFLIYGNGTETTHVTTKTMTYPLQLKKIKKGDAIEKVLPGATFQIIREFDKATIHFTKISDTEYKVDPEGTVTEINTVAETPITLLGLGAEDYIVVETEAPEGHDLLQNSVTVGGTEYQHAQSATVSATSQNGAVQVAKIEDPKTGEEPIDPDPDPTPDPTPAPTQVSGVLMAKMKAKGSTAVDVTWNSVSSAEGYDIYFGRCNGKDGTEGLKKTKTVKADEKRQWTKTGLKQKKSYKVIVKAYTVKKGKKEYIKTSTTSHAYVSGSTKNYTNAKAVTVKKTKVALEKGKTFKIKAKVKKLKKSKKLMPKKHVATLRYLSSNEEVATVSKAGIITANGEGTCKIYVFAHNGVSKKIKVTVK